MSAEMELIKSDIIKLAENVEAQGNTIVKLTQRINAMEAMLITRRSTIKFKTLRIKSEFDDIRLDPRLKVILYALAGFAMHRFGKEITLTDIYREQEEQDSIYSNNPDYVDKPWYSVHQFWRGTDVGTRDFSDSEVDEMVDFLNLFIYTGEYKTAKNHNIKGWHIHIQCDADGRTTIA